MKGGRGKTLMCETVVCPQADVLVKALSDLDSAASSDAAVREKIAALPPEVSDISNLDKLQGKR